MHRADPFLLLLVLVAAAAQAAPRVVTHAPQPGRDLQAVEDAGRWNVRDGSVATPVALPAHARIDAVAPAGPGWMAAGTRADSQGRERIFFLRGDASGAREVPAPAVGAGSSADPVLLGGDRSVSGAAWLEGTRAERFAIRYARWEDDHFAAPVTISPPGPGSQLALSGTTLADGRVLLVWAGFDGGDDEIWASVSNGGGWSLPTRVALDNQVPDITPAVAPTSPGALVVWSRFDGSEYRLAGSVFDGHRFREVGYVAPPGSLYPTFEVTGDPPTLLYRDARSNEWVAAQVSSRGALLRSSRIAAGETDDRPQVHADASGAIWEFGARRVATPWK
jgi:hypothetical protein